MCAPWDTSVLRVVGHQTPVLLAASSQRLELPPPLTATLVPQGNTASVLEAHSLQVGDFICTGSEVTHHVSLVPVPSIAAHINHCFQDANMSNEVKLNGNSGLIIRPKLHMMRQIIIPCLQHFSNTSLG